MEPFLITMAILVIVFAAGPVVAKLTKNDPCVVAERQETIRHQIETGRENNYRSCVR